MVLVDLTKAELRAAKKYVIDSWILEELEKELYPEYAMKFKALKPNIK